MDGQKRDVRRNLEIRRCYQCCRLHHEVLATVYELVSPALEHCNTRVQRARADSRSYREASRQILVAGG